MSAARRAASEHLLAGRAPFDGAALLAFLARRAVPGVEATVAGAYHTFGHAVGDDRPL